MPADFPISALPEETGLLIADGFGAALVRAAPRHPMVAARRRAVTLRYALAAGLCLGRLEDPGRNDLEPALLT